MSDSEPNDVRPPSIFTPEELERMPEDLRPKAEIIIEGYEAFHGPLPHPGVLAQYDKAMPGLSEKLVLWAEDETRHRRDIERKVFDEERRSRLWGQAIGAVVSLVGLLAASGLGFIAAIYSSAAAAGVAIVVAIVSVGGPFAARLLARGWRGRSSRDE